jgi:nucleotidyltransferase/DNA polymerase involved in DNA repair
MPFACIFVPDFPAEAILRAESALRSQAVAVLEGKLPLQKVFAVNENARRAGIEPGMTKIQLEPFTEIVLRLRSSLQETAAHAALLDCAQSFSPRVEDTAPDTVILDLSGLESLFGSLPKIARDIARRTSDLGLEANVATAFNPDTARFAARGFSGVTVIAEGKEAERMGNLPLDVLFPELTSPEPSEDAARLLETFDLWGVRNFRALCALPEVALSERLGRRGVGLQQLARGAISRTLVPVDPPLIFEEAMELDHPVVLLEPLAFLLAHMLDQLCARLAARALAAQNLRLQLHLDNGFQFVEDVPVDEASTSKNSRFAIPDSPLMNCHPEQSESPTLKACHPERSEGPAFPPRMAPPPTRNLKPETRNSTFTRTIELPIPMLDAKVFLKLLQLDLKAHPPGAPILKVHLSATPAQPRTTQGGLFLPATPEPEKLELTLARIAGMVGEDKVGSLQLLDSHRPEAFRMQRFVPVEPSGKKEVAASDNSRAPVTALRVFRPPLRATVTLRDGKPAHVVCNKRKEINGDIVWMAGPWRSSGDWWEQDGWARDEWDIALQTSVAGGQSPVASKSFADKDSLALYRLVHDLFSGHWFVEGTYD